MKTFQDPSNHWKVTALVSGRDEKKQKYARDLEALQVNVREQSFDAVAKAAPDVVISCITTGKGDMDPVYMRNQLFVDAALELGVKKYVFLSSVGAGSSEVALPGPAKETMKPFMTDKHRAEVCLSYLKALAASKPSFSSLFFSSPYRRQSILTSTIRTFSLTFSFSAAILGIHIHEFLDCSLRTSERYSRRYSPWEAHADRGT